MLKKLCLSVAMLLSAGVWTGSVAHAETVSLIGEDDWYPYSAKKDGKLQGFAVDIVKAAYAAAGVDLQLKTMPYARCMEVVKQGEELGCFDSADVPELRKEFVFHKQPLFNAEIAIYTLAGNEGGKPLTVADLKNKTVGITNGYTYGAELEDDASIKKDTAPSDLVNVRKLLAGRVKYSLVYTRVMDSLIASNAAEFQGKVKQVGSVTKHGLFVTFSPKKPESKRYAELLDKGLNTIRGNGVFADIEKKWQTPPK